jgi:TolB protein
MDADGSHVSLLTRLPRGNMTPAFSPDGRRIAFASPAGGSLDIFVMDRDGSNVTRLTNPAAFGKTPRRPFAFRPAFSPDGRRIVFTWGIDGSEQIYMMNTDGSHSIRLTSPPGNCDFPSFSPDGRKIAFQSDRDGSRQIYVMDAEGTHVTRLTNPPGENGFPVFSP